jgi:hypothetical protein
MIFAKTHTGARVPLGTTLTNNNIASDYRFATEFLDAKASASCITTIAG